MELFRGTVLTEHEKFIAELQSLFCILFLEVLQKLHFVREKSSLFFLAHCEHTKDSLLFGMTNGKQRIWQLCIAGRPAAVGRCLLFRPNAAMYLHSIKVSECIFGKSISSAGVPFECPLCQHRGTSF
jgi:hypothetical protein